MIAELADGTELEFPDGTSPDVVRATVKRVIAERATTAKPTPQRSLGEDLGRQVGLTARAGIKGVLAIPSMVGDAAFSLSNLAQRAFGATDLQPPGRTSRALDNILNVLGLPQPENATERVAGDVASALAGTGALGKAAQLMTGPVQSIPTLSNTGRVVDTATMARPLSAASVAGRPVEWSGMPVAGSTWEAVAPSLYSGMGTQAISTAAGSGAAGVTRELGGGAGAQLAAGLTAGVGVPMGMQALFNRAGPTGFLARSMNKSEATPFAQEGERIARETGIELTPGARTGNRFMTAMENTARQYGPTADRVQDVDLKIANQAINRVGTIADKISKNVADPENLGEQIRTTIQSAAKQLDKMRETVAGRDYGLVRQIAGDGKVIRLQGFADELKSIIDDYANVAGADAQKVVAQARAALNRITGVVEPGTPTRVIEAPVRNIKLYGEAPITGTLDNTINKAMRTRSFYEKAARGSANVFEDIAPDMQRSLASRLFRAINEDFDNAATTANGPLKEALTQANSNYKRASQSIQFLEKSALGKLIGEDLVDAAMSGAKVSTTSGEQIAEKLATMHPSVRRTSIQTLGRWNPQLAIDLRAQFLRDALDKGMAIAPSAKGSSQVPISFNKFLTALGSEKVGFQKNLESYGFSASEIKDIKDTAAAMLRQGDRTGFNFSGTEVMRQNSEVAQAFGDAALSATTGGATGLVRNIIGKTITFAGKRIGMNKIVDAMSSAEGRQALQTISNPKASPQAIIAAFTTIDQ